MVSKISQLVLAIDLGDKLLLNPRFDMYLLLEFILKFVQLAWDLDPYLARERDKLYWSFINYIRDMTKQNSRQLNT